LQEKEGEQARSAGACAETRRGMVHPSRQLQGMLAIIGAAKQPSDIGAVQYRSVEKFEQEQRQPQQVKDRARIISRYDRRGQRVVNHVDAASMIIKIIYVHK
jgi:hypothetical protein